MITIARPARTFIDSTAARKAAKEYAHTRGHFGARGGWIYYHSERNGTVRSICQGWDEYEAKFYREIRNYLTQRLTAFDSFDDLVNAAPQYRPTIIPRTWREQYLADSYDHFQDQRGDDRRAWRGSNV